jgi:hypothetical protein
MTKEEIREEKMKRSIGQGNKLGTVWVTKGKGSTASQLGEAINFTYGYGFGSFMDEAWERLASFKNSSHRTNLLLNGRDLTEYDLSRISLCE